MSEEKYETVLITVKTYPTFSKSHTELVCTAGLREDGSWIRLYPFPFRLLDEDKKYKKYNVIRLPVRKNKKDFRIESYNPVDLDAVEIKREISTGKKRDWSERRHWVLKRPPYKNMNHLIRDAKETDMSLAVFKPHKVLDFEMEPIPPEDLDKKNKEYLVEQAKQQGSLFEDHKIRDDFKAMPVLPYKFKYVFQDETGKKRTLMIEDWEVGQLFWACQKKAKIKGLSPEDANEEACCKVRDKYLSFTEKDFYFFMGTTLRWHKRGKNPFVIIGVFYPPYEEQLTLL